MKSRIYPSLLAADMGALRAGAQRAEAAGADALHVDIMDGHFVPNLSMGPAVVAMAREAVALPLNVHLMMTNPDRHADRFLDAGATSLLVHIELDDELDLEALLGSIRERGARPGLVANPETPAERLFPLLPFADEILCMTVSPGFGGQAFIESVLPKIRILRQYCLQQGWAPDILVDGGVDVERAVQCAAEGANAFVAGTSLYRATDMAGDIDRMRRTAQETYDRHFPYS